MGVSQIIHCSIWDYKNQKSLLKTRRNAKIRTRRKLKFQNQLAGFVTSKKLERTNKRRRIDGRYHCRRGSLWSSFSVLYFCPSNFCLSPPFHRTRRRRFIVIRRKDERNDEFSLLPDELNLGRAQQILDY